jgi:hypothetical protein
VRAPTAISVDDDLATSQASITLRTTNDKATRGLNLKKARSVSTARLHTKHRFHTYMIDGPIVKEVLRDNLLDHLLQYLLPELLRRDLLSVLCGNDDRVDAQGDRRATVLLILDRDLGLRVGAEPRERARAARGSQRSIEFMRKHDSERHILGRLVRSIAKHDALIAGTVVLERAVVEPLCDIGGLLLDRDEDVARLVVEALGRVVVPDVLDRVADHLLVVELRFGADLAEDHDHARLRGRLAGDLRRGVLLEAGIELCIVSQTYVVFIAYRGGLR